MDIRRVSIFAATIIAIPMAVIQFRQPRRVTAEQIEARYNSLFPPLPPAEAMAFAPPPPQPLLPPAVTLPPLPPLPAIQMPGQGARSIDVTSIATGTTLNLSTGRPVVSQEKSDVEFLDRALKEIDTASKDVTFEPTARPAGNGQKK